MYFITLCTSVKNKFQRFKSEPVEIAVRLDSSDESACFSLDVFQKITVAECIETQSKAMMMLTIEQLSYLLKFALQKMKQPGVSTLFPLFIVNSCYQTDYIVLWKCLITDGVYCIFSFLPFSNSTFRLIT